MDIKEIAEQLKAKLSVFEKMGYGNDVATCVISGIEAKFLIDYIEEKENGFDMPNAECDASEVDIY